MILLYISVLRLSKEKIQMVEVQKNLLLQFIIAIITKHSGYSLGRI
jgi:hypothetical protein